MPVQPAFPEHVPLSRWGWGAPPLEPVARLLAAGEEQYRPMLEQARNIVEWATTIPRGGTEQGEPDWDNPFWTGLSALLQCGALRARNPARYVEIGSGWSTLFARRAIADFGLQTRIVSIDPSPRVDVEAATDEMMRVSFQDVDQALFESLAPGDIVAMDGSHVSAMNSDVTVFMLETLPRIPSGVLVSIHDILLPWDYPAVWSTRNYAEQYLLAAFLLGGAAGWTVRFPGWWVVKESGMRGELESIWTTLAVPEKRRNCSSFWLERE